MNFKKDKKTVVVGMSGGVDSTMAAYLLKKRGFDVAGVTMKIWNKKLKFKPTKSGCFGPGEEEDIAMAKKAADKLGIPHHVVELADEYRREVLDYFRKEYLSGKTPNPCVMCNVKIKFGHLMQKIISGGVKFDFARSAKQGSATPQQYCGGAGSYFLATGHYARVEFDAKQKLYLLKRGRDRIKDQSYFLYRLSQKQLGKILLPLGNYRKSGIKKLAERVGFGEWAAKSESQDFLECEDYAFLLGEPRKGDIVDFSGKKIGEHKGFWRYTIGQRKGLGISALKEPYYVLEIDSGLNRLIVGPKKMLFSKKAKVRDLNWIILPSKKQIKNIRAKIRYGSLAAKCGVKIDKNKTVVEFEKAQLAPTPGQSIVFYDKDIVLGGGIIS